MIGAGITLTPAQKAELDRLSGVAGTLRDERQALLDGKIDKQSELDGLANEAADAGNAYQIAGENFSDDKADADRLQADYRNEKAEARSEEQRLRGKEDQRTEFARQIEDLDRRLGTQENEARILERTAKFFANYNRDELISQHEIACIQGICENMNAGGAIILCCHAASMKLNAAKIDQKSGAPVTLDKPKYLNIAVDRIKPTHLTYQNEADAQEARVADLKDQLADKNADRFHDQEVADAKVELADKVADRDQAEVDYKHQDKDADASKAGRDKKRIAAQDAQKAQRAMDAILREYDQKIAAKGGEQEANSTEQQRIINQASVTTT